MSRRKPSPARSATNRKSVTTVALKPRDYRPLFTSTGIASTPRPGAAAAGGCVRQLCRMHRPALLHQFDLAQPPFLREERFKRAVETKQGEPTLAGHGLDPVTPLDARRLGWTEVNRRGAVCLRFGGGGRIALAAGARIALRRVEHRAGLVVVKRERPERSGGNAFRQRYLVGFAAVEGVLVRVQKSHEILRTDAGKPHDHARGVQGVGVVERGF